MKKQIIHVKNKKVKVTDIKAVLQEHTEVSAAYLFGSSVQGDSVVNDLDILILLDGKYSDKHAACFELLHKLSVNLNLPEDYIDLLLFDYQQADPSVLKKAVNDGILIKNDDPDYLSDKIDKFSRYLMENETMMIRASHLRQERLEEFCETRS